MKKTAISYSSASRFKECAQKFYYSKQYKTTINASALFFGKAVEAGIDALVEDQGLTTAFKTFKQDWHTSPANQFDNERVLFDSSEMFYYASDYDKNLLIQHEKILQVWLSEIYQTSEVLGWEIIVKKVQDQIKKEEKIEAKDRQFYHRVMWLCCRQRGIHLIQAFYEQILPNIEEVVSSQERISIKNADGDEAIGYVDYIFKYKGYDQPIVFDLKTAGRPYTQHELDTSDQLRLYAAAKKLNNIGYLILLKKISFEKSCDQCDHIRENYRLKKCSKCKKGTYSKSKPKPKTQIMIKTLETREVEDMVEDYSNILTAIKNKVTWKNPKSCNNFNKKCEFYDLCWKNKQPKDIKELIERDG
jgi:hypothetical protein